MRARFFQYLEAIRSSYWFIPSLMALGAIGMALGMPYLDGRIGQEWLDAIGWLYANKPDGARTLLSTVAGSMIGVAGVTFSITIASVVYASSQYGPRLLTNFMRDKGNQVTLGTFIATFIYCVLVLRTIRNADEPIGTEGTPGAEVIGAFVPHASILLALFFALASIGVFIYFIHHIPDSIHVSNVIAGIGRDLNTRIEQIFPEQMGDPFEEVEDVAHLPDGFAADAEAIETLESGYIQNMDEKGLIALAARHDLIIRMEYRPGDFVVKNKALVRAWPADHVDEDVEAELRGTFALGRQRTQAQDLMFLVNELVEIAARALSPGINDPFTAISCMDWLGSAIGNLAVREIPSAYRYDGEGTLRVVTRPITFEAFADAILDQLRPYVSADRNAALHMYKMLAEVAPVVQCAQHEAALREQADALKLACRDTLTHPRDQEAISDRHRVLMRLLHDPADEEAEAEKQGWYEANA